MFLHLYVGTSFFEGYISTWIPSAKPSSYNFTLHSYTSDGVFCKPLQALMLAIVVFFFFLALTNVP